MVVRPARPHDLADAGAVTEAAYRAAGLAVGGYVDALRDACRRADEAELLVAVDAGGAVVGSVTFCPPGARGESWRATTRQSSECSPFGRTLNASESAAR